MKLIIFGATGTIGKELVRQALAQGHQVTAFMRDPAKLDLTNPNLCKHRGDVLKFEDVLQAINGHDAVLCALGAGRKGQVRAEGTNNIIKAMERERISRLICQTTRCGRQLRQPQFLLEAHYVWMVSERCLRRSPVTGKVYYAK